MFTVKQRTGKNKIVLEGGVLQNIEIQIVPRYNKTISSSLVVTYSKLFQKGGLTYPPPCIRACGKKIKITKTVLEREIVAKFEYLNIK
jgi:hypothetical protein